MSAAERRRTTTSIKPSTTEPVTPNIDALNAVAMELSGPRSWLTIVVIAV